MKRHGVRDDCIDPEATVGDDEDNDGVFATVTFISLLEFIDLETETETEAETDELEWKQRLGMKYVLTTHTVAPPNDTMTATAPRWRGVDSDPVSAQGATIIFLSNPPFPQLTSFPYTHPS